MMRNFILSFVANSQNMGEESGWVGDVEVRCNAEIRNMKLGNEAHEGNPIPRILSQSTQTTRR